MLWRTVAAIILPVCVQEAHHIQVTDEKRRRFLELVRQQKTVCPAACHCIHIALNTVCHCIRSMVLHYFIVCVVLLL